MNVFVLTQASRTQNREEDLVELWQNIRQHNYDITWAFSQFWEKGEEKMNSVKVRILCSFHNKLKTSAHIKLLTVQEETDTKL